MSLTGKTDRGRVRVKECLTIRDLGDLAQWDTGRSGLDLRLAIGQRADNCGGDNLRTDDLAIAALRRGSPAWHDQNLDGRALGSPVAVVQVVEVAALALVEDGGAAQRQGAVATSREAGCVDGTSLRGLVVLELVVASNVASATLGVEKGAIGQGGDEDAVARAGRTHLEACQSGCSR